MPIEDRLGRNGRGRWLAVAVCAALAAAPGARAGVETIEEWTAGGTAGWTNEAAGAVLGNPGGYLELRFNRQAIPAPVEDRASVALPPGILLTNLQFAFRATNVAPGAVRVVLTAGSVGHIWQLNLGRPAVGGWQVYRVPIAYHSAWFRNVTGGANDFAADLQAIDRVAVFVRRNGDPQEQQYGIDAFTLQGLAIDPADRDGDGMPDVWEAQNALDPDDAVDATGDADGDGMTNFAEYRAGTDPRDAASVFAVRIDRSPVPPGAPVEGVVLSWNSISNRTYAVWRTLDLAGAAMGPVETGVPATPPVNSYLAPVATNTRAGFFRIDVEGP